MTIELFREDGYRKECDAKVISADDRGICVDQTVFYPQGGGQPGDTGTLIRENGEKIAIIDTRKELATGEHLHLAQPDIALPVQGERVLLRLDWERRYRLMRMHSCMHLLCAVVPAGVTGGSVREDSARLDFDLPDPPDKLQIEEDLKRLIAENHTMRLEWITDEDLEQQPELVRTMSVKPPTGAGRVRLVRFEGVDLQPCGGTHVAATGEIGRVRVRKIEKKGKKNRRITVEFV